MPTPTSWSKIKMHFALCDYSYDGHDGFGYHGPSDGGYGTEKSQFFYTKADAQDKIFRWKRDGGPTVGEVLSSTNYSTGSITLWMKGKGKNKRFSLTKPKECNSPCVHCKILNTKGFTLREIMEKKGVSRIELLNR